MGVERGNGERGRGKGRAGQEGRGGVREGEEVEGNATGNGAA